MAETESATSLRAAIPPNRRRMVAGGSIGTLMEYYDYYLYGLASATVFPAVFSPSGNAPPARSNPSQPSPSGSSCGRSAA